MHPDTPFLLVPLVLFVSIAYAIRAAVDARSRVKMADLAVSAEVVQAIMLAEEARRLRAGLRWGLVLTSLAAGLVIVEIVGWSEPTPGALGILVGATGFGNLIYFLLAPPLQRRARSAAE
jgi:hypothetical protein